MRGLALATVLAFGLGCSPAPSPSSSPSQEVGSTEQPPPPESSCDDGGEVSYECFCSTFDCEASRDEFLVRDGGGPVYRHECGSVDGLTHSDLSGLSLAFSDRLVVAGSYADDLGYFMTTPGFPSSSECNEPALSPSRTQRLKRERACPKTSFRSWRVALAAAFWHDKRSRKENSIPHALSKTSHSISNPRPALCTLPSCPKLPRRRPRPLF